MQKYKIIFIILILFTFSCEKHKNMPSGNFNDIIIIASNKDSIYIKPLIDKYIFNDSLYTPEIQPIYNVKWVDYKKFKHYKKFSKIFILSLDEPKDSTVDIFTKRFLTKKNNSSNSTYIENIHSQPQIISVINSLNNNSFDSLLKSISTDIKTLINSNTYDVLTEERKKKSFDTTLVNLTYNIFKKKILYDQYFKLIDTLLIKDNKYLWAGKGSINTNNSNYQWIIINEHVLDEIEGNVDLSNKVIYDIKKFNNEIEVLSSYNIYSKNIFSDRTVYSINTLYNLDKYKTGGPLVIYRIDNYKTKKSITLYGLVNAPGQNKIKYIKELESMLRNSIF
jgi:hypothetical protein